MLLHTITYIGFDPFWTKLQTPYEKLPMSKLPMKTPNVQTPYENSHVQTPDEKLPCPNSQIFFYRGGLQRIITVVIGAE